MVCIARPRIHNSHKESSIHLSQAIHQFSYLHKCIQLSSYTPCHARFLETSQHSIHSTVPKPSCSQSIHHSTFVMTSNVLEKLLVLLKHINLME